jgi:hypothetical protein
MYFTGAGLISSCSNKHDYENEKHQQKIIAADYGFECGS